jgi:hypothetical protein
LERVWAIVMIWQSRHTGIVIIIILGLGGVQGALMESEGRTVCERLCQGDAGLVVEGVIVMDKTDGASLEILRGW